LFVEVGNYNVVDIATGAIAVCLLLFQLPKLLVESCQQRLPDCTSESATLTILVEVAAYYGFRTSVSKGHIREINCT
jgi:hypothetical protein